jgi:hypothetical protein
MAQRSSKRLNKIPLDIQAFDSNAARSMTVEYGKGNNGK